MNVRNAEIEEDDRERQVSDESLEYVEKLSQELLEVMVRDAVATERYDHNSESI